MTCGDDHECELERTERLGRPQRNSADHIAPTPVTALTATLDRPATGRPARRCPRCGTGSTSCRCIASRRSVPTATPSAAASCRRFRCRGACGPAASSSSTRRCASGDALTRTSTIARRHGEERPHRTARVRQGAPRDPRATAAGGRRWPNSTTSSTARRRSPTTSRRRRKQAPAESRGNARWMPDDVLLFRYSALTFNGHRIHYDRRYVTEVEGYPGLIVHGPMIATLLLDLLRHKLPDAEVAALRIPRRAADVRHQSLLRLRRAAAPTARRSACGRRITKAGWRWTPSADRSRRTVR